MSNENILIEEASRLVRSCRKLVWTGEMEAGYFIGGKREDGVETPDWVNIRGDILGFNGGWLNVTVDRRGLTGTAALVNDLGSRGVGKSVYYEDSECWPFIDDIFQKGSDRLDQWLHKHSWRREWGYNSNLKAWECGEYAKILFGKHPFYDNEIAGFIGGWAQKWPEDEEYRDSDHLLLTITANSEPWVEVWKTEAGLQVVPRVT